MAASNDDIFRQAITSFQAGRLNDAEKYLKQVLHQQPAHVAALILGILLTSLKKYDEAGHYVQSALNINLNSDATFYYYASLISLKHGLVAAMYFLRPIM